MTRRDFVAGARLVDHAGVRIHVIDTGPIGGERDGRPPIVFVPGVSDVADDYLEMLPAFGRRVAVVDLRGRGGSDSPPSGYAMADHVGDIAAVVDSVTDGPIHLMTFSRGTCYGVGWALANPGRVRSVSIGDYPVREIAFPDTETFASDFLGTTWRGMPVRDRITETAFRGILVDAVHRPMWTDLAALDLPLLVVRAHAGSPISDDDWDRYVTHFPRSTRVVFEGSPHDIFRADRLRYPQLVRAHVDAVDHIEAWDEG